MSRLSEVEDLVESAKGLPTWSVVQPILGLAASIAEQIDENPRPNAHLVRELRMCLKDAINMMGEMPEDTSELDELRGL